MCDCLLVVCLGLTSRSRVIGRALDRQAAVVSVAADRVQRCLRPPTRSALPSARCSRPRWRLSAARSGPGQIAMAEAVGDALTDHRHLVVQAGTGTGKSLAYLVPALLHDQRVVVATATLALQHQLVERDIPRLVEAVGATHPEVDASYAVLKGRSNYACLHRIREGVPDEQGALIEVPEGSLGKKVLELRAWAEEEAESKGSGERDNAPRHTDREWRQVSVSHRDCLGAVALPVRRGVLRRAGTREGAPLPPDRHQPLPARDRRDRGGADDPRLRRGGGRRGPRGRQPGHAGGHRRAVRGRGRPRRSALAALGHARARRSRRRPTTSPTPATRWRRRSASASRAASTRSPRRWPTRWCWCATPRGPACRRTPRRATPSDADAGRTQARGSPCRRSSPPPSGWRRGRRPTCSG